MKTLLAVAAALLAAALGFVAGSWWHAQLALEPPPGAAVAPIAMPRERECPPCREPQLPDPVPGEPPQAQCLEVRAAFDTVNVRLNETRAMLSKCEERVLARDGAPLPPAARPKEPRFEPEALRSAVSTAFTEVRVPGRVDGLDCTEWPCIVYGRIRGTEDEMEKLEGAKALAAYERDVLTVLLWVVTDEAAHEGPLPGLPGRPEQTLYAFAWYPRGLERPLAENLDRRLRSRTAELWNTMSPSDETGR